MGEGENTSGDPVSTAVDQSTAVFQVRSTIYVKGAESS